ncbi:MAG: LssY C-terminal domain-containing protein [Renibacterium sp.]|nr:LssY C-terminal domain-containing protein [Renibacterium sp.]
MEAPEKRRWSVNLLVDNLFFIFSGVASVWLALLVLGESFSGGWTRVWYVVPFWLVLAYVALPRLHRILTSIYVPDYFIGRSRTADGLLGDPINLAVCGSQEQLESSMVAAGWTKADEITLLSSWRIIVSTLTRRSYHEAPVSTLTLFGRQQDFAYQQEVEDSPAKRHHVRFWRCPEGWLLPGGHHADWLAAGTFDKSVGLSLFTFQITHKIDEHIDKERDHIIDTLARVTPGIRVEVIKDFSTGYHSRNGGGDAIKTDGDLPIVYLDAVPITKPAVAEEETAEIPGTEVAVPILERPLPTMFGAFFGLFSAITTIIWGMLFLTSNPSSEILQGEAGSPAELALLVEGVTAVVVTLLGLIALVQLVLAVFVWTGHNWARITLMAVTSLSTVIAFITAFQDGTRITLSADLLNTNLLTITLQILTVLALSSSKARAYARRRRA